MSLEAWIHNRTFARALPPLAFARRRSQASDRLTVCSASVNCTGQELNALLADDVCCTTVPKNTHISQS